ncbi:phycobilisome rod-core linker polypeptide [Anabaena cylindrica FACHB-243]|uniref:Phycobilisome linker polypeptide n=1 Tax=Anabaena cylindrica (strain ATCC 27899 / PCC 7122) TaxID=272123 RepID=K9ZG95_ANACC|nr:MULTISPECIES: phycobilisome rod-core linker polypeptide [Anabaena]AFZ57390.1 Phycobilisome linker polypeptide [Anabaena cylindrica PCC 7122]MBD2421072.1 phycobilisome rod-core linker polypeptide [Anabaena cylindrica FACHB-243]MBY5284954.1 phycobilisome rod-core linker polypeptide CpcG1 [Anabaena sp. CCAP 1446/1C]MBY5306358.1 phycobilisome rod-core linker polypeptide CpcG1 [Anabaena sp. CCAP 1446/1C]MCM2405825.1 phycobilisome rod-core linker polypeptide [Anabaena sp. CCAP 1446/1C]
MSIPLLEYSPSSQNQRVDGYEVPNEDTPTIYRLNTATSDADIDAIIWAGYRQIFSEHLILESYRQSFLESQLRNRAINVRDFIRGLGKSDVYRTQVADTNSNYRLVDITLKRFLGRAAYNKDEEIAWSIVIATKGLHGFIDALLDSSEYLENFGDDIVPFQRRRYGSRPFNLVNPRYNEYWRDTQNIRGMAGRSFYSTRTSGTLTTEDIRKAIPANFFAMAGKIITTERNYQRIMASVSSQITTMEIPNTTREIGTEQPTIKPVAVALPYRYIPGNQMN